MTGDFTSAMRALVVATLLFATATVMLVTMSRARASGVPGMAADGACCGLPRL